MLRRGWGYATLGYTSIQADAPNQWSSGVIGQTLEEGQTQPAPDEWGTISAWAWGVSRSIDYLEQEKAVEIGFGSCGDFAEPVDQFETDAFEADFAALD